MREQISVGIAGELCSAARRPSSWSSREKRVRAMAEALSEGAVFREIRDSLSGRGEISTMSGHVAQLLAGALLIAVAVSGCSPERVVHAPDERQISLLVLEDKIRGGWAGQMIGVTYGAPTEFQYLERLVPEENIPQWNPEVVRGALDQDDLYVDITLAQVLDDKGLDATTEDFGAFLREADYRLWHANLAARRALRRGVPATASGTPMYNVHANDIDFQIEADFIGLMAPAMPRASNDFCERAGRVMNSGDGLYGGMFVSAMYSAAFFESDPRAIVEAGVAALPAESPYARVIADVLRWSLENPDNWVRVWELIDETWNRREPCPEGALRSQPGPRSWSSPGPLQPLRHSWQLQPQIPSCNSPSLP